VVWFLQHGSHIPAGWGSKRVFLTHDQSSGPGFGPPGYGSVIVCTDPDMTQDPDPTQDPNPSINKQKN
jgi:hypothetical protein